MKERPIIMSGDSVKAILEGRKTQTRRPIKPQPEKAIEGHLLRFPERWEFTSSGCCDNDIVQTIKCPYGQVGHRLWVREKHKFGVKNDDFYNSILIEITYNAFPFPKIRDVEITGDDWNYSTKLGIWRPSIFMPRWASRITLEIVNVKVERLQTMTLNDIKAEGMERSSENDETLTEYVCYLYHMFKTYWNKFNKKPEFKWEANPFCWVISFKRS